MSVGGGVGAGWLRRLSCRIWRARKSMSVEAAVERRTRERVDCWDDGVDTSEMGAKGELGRASDALTSSGLRER